MDKPNYTQCPNMFFDEIMKDLKEAELKVFLAIIRKTFGFHKDKDQISISQLMEITGMSRQGVLNGLYGKDKNSGIVGKGYIKQNIKGQSYTYQIVFSGEQVNDIDQKEKASSQRSRPEVVNEVDRTGQRSRPEVVNEVDTQKKERNFSKEIYKERDFTKEFERLKESWNGHKNLPQERRMLVTCGEKGDIMNNMNLYTFEEMVSAVKNYAELHDKLDFKYKTFVNFM